MHPSNREKRIAKISVVYKKHEHGSETAKTYNSSMVDPEAGQLPHFFFEPAKVSASRSGGSQAPVRTCNKRHSQCHKKIKPEPREREAGKHCVPVVHPGEICGHTVRPEQSPIFDPDEASF